MKIFFKIYPHPPKQEIKNFLYTNLVSERENLPFTLFEREKFLTACFKANTRLNMFGQ